MTFKIKSSLRLAGSGIAVMVATMPLLANAQEVAQEETAAAAKADSGLTDIVVTAQRRQESSQQVPISMTVLDEGALSKLQSTNQIGQVVPNVQIEQTSGFGIPRMGIRGISQSDFNATATTANMVYLDDLPMNAAIAQGVPIWDLARAEVLRGPQGTLFGRNASGGAIRYISAMPTHSWTGYGEVTIGRFSKNEVRAAIGGPVTDTLGIRLAYVGNWTDGDIYNVTYRERQGKQAYWGARAIVEWKPVDRLTVTLRGQYFNSNIHPVMWKTTPGLVAGDAFGPLPDGRTVAQLQASYGFQNLGYQTDFTVSENNARPNEHLRHIPVSATFDLDLGGATLTSVIGFLDVDHSFIVDNDATQLPILDEYDVNSGRQWTQEVRLASNGDGPFKWIAGAFYIHEKMDAAVNFDSTEWRGNTVFPGSPTLLYRRGIEQKLESWAGFLHTTYQITPELMLTAAGRYTWEKKRATYEFRSQWNFPTAVPRTPQQFFDFKRAVETGNFGQLVAPAAAPLSGEKSWTNLSWKFALDYKPSNRTLFYALVSRGFKGGAFPPTANVPAGIVDASGQVIAVKPETVTDYELGFKADIIPRRLRINGSAFYYDYKNFQTNQFVAALASQVLSSLPKTRLLGAELEIQSVPLDNLHLDASIGVTDTKITKALDPTLIGNKLPLAEDFNANGALRYDIHTGIGTLSPEISVKYRGHYFTNKENDTKLGGYALVNARIGFESTNQNFYGSVWINNLTDQRDAVAIDDATEFFGSNLAYILPRKTYGLTFGARF